MTNHLIKKAEDSKLKTYQNGLSQITSPGETHHYDF